MTLESDGGIFVTHTFGLDYYINKAEDCKPLLSYTDKKMIAIGHTHVFAEHLLNGVTIVNPGSISKGRQHTRPTYAMIDGDRVIRRELGDWR